MRLGLYSLSLFLLFTRIVLADITTEETDGILHQFNEIQKKASCYNEVNNLTICEKSYDELCKLPGVQVAHDNQRKYKSKFLKKHAVLLSELSGETSVSDEKKIEDLVSIENKIYDDHKIKKVKIDRILEQIKLSLLNEVKKSFVLPQESKKWEEVVKLVNQIEIHSIAKRYKMPHQKVSDPFSPSELQHIQSSCGNDGLKGTGTYWAQQNIIMLCPGFFMGASQGTLDIHEVIVGLLSHEIAHSVDAFSMVGLKYDHFEACIQKNYADRLNSPKQACQYFIEKGIPGLKSEITKMEKQNPSPLDEIHDAKQLLSEFEPVKKWEQCAQSPDTDIKYVVKDHLGEMSADFLSSQILAARMKTMTEAGKRELIEQKVLHFCREPREERIRKILWGEYTMGEHPNYPLRTELFFKNPEIRKALGCTKVSINQKPFCSMLGEDH